MVCGKEFYVPHWRDKTAKYCSRECSDSTKPAKPNVICTHCGKPFHMKPYQQKKTNRRRGYFCSKKCHYEYMKKWFCGENNHQYGLRGNLNPTFVNKDITYQNHKLTETMVYDPYRMERVARHRFVVELNHDKFDDKFFVYNNGSWALKKGYVVHHKDGNHSNDSLENLEILTKSEHSSYHNKVNPMPHDKFNGRFIKRSSISNID